MSEIPHELRALGATLKAQATRLSTAVRALKATRYGEPLSSEISDLLVTLAGHHADINQLQSLVAAAGMTGQLQPRPQMHAEELELGALQAAEDPRQRALLLESLHRANDHTMDEEGDDDA